MGSIAILQLPDACFNPDLRFLSVWSFLFEFSHEFVWGFFQVLQFLPTVQKYADTIADAKLLIDRTVNWHGNGLAPFLLWVFESSIAKNDYLIQ